MSMEHNGDNQNMPPPSTMCRQGCGFYGNANFEGMCSKCYKDVMKRRQANVTPTAPLSGRGSPAVMLNDSLPMAMSSTLVPAATATSVETASPTVPAATPSSSQGNKDDISDHSTDSSAASSPAAAALDSGSDDGKEDKDKKPKKSRCHMCKKKVGLTGFQCRCGGLYCGLHRYSDKHNCSFNYREFGQEQIRRNNPVVVGEKIQKI